MNYIFNNIFSFIISIFHFFCCFLYGGWAQFQPHRVPIVSQEAIKMDTQCPEVQLDHPVTGGHKYGVLIQHIVLGSEADSRHPVKQLL